MALTNCKECKKEISTEAKACPYCGINNPGGGVIDNSNRSVGVVVLVMIIFLFTYLLTSHEKVTYQYNEDARISENKEAGVAKLDQKAFAIQSSSEQSKPIETPTPSQQLAIQITPQPPVNQEPPKREKLEPRKRKNISTADISQNMVMHMLEYALKDGGLSQESEIQKTKLQIERLPKPANGNKTAARVINAKGLKSSKNGDFNNAVKLFEEAHKLDKSDIEIANNLGFSYLKDGNLDSAQQVITITLTLSPDRAIAWENLGEIFGIKGDTSKAVACFSNAYRFSKDRLKMNQYMKKLNEKEAVETLKQARAKAINWAEKSYLNISKKTE
jgi:tetratricopeptide (TPR) repeat protein